MHRPAPAPKQLTASQWGGRALLFIAGLLFAIGAAEFVVRSLPADAYDPGEMEGGLIAYDSHLGWRMAAHKRVGHRHQDFAVHYSTDSDGFRRTVPGWNAALPATLILGDSFTFGIGVEDQDTFVSRMAEASPGENVLNAGVIGYSTDQELLYLQELQKTIAIDRLVLIVFLGNDLLDNQFDQPTQAPYNKPFFELGRAGLSLNGVPVPPMTQNVLRRNRTTEILTDAYHPHGFIRAMESMELGRRVLAFKRAHWGHPRLEFGARVDRSLELFAALLQSMSAEARPLTVFLLPGRSVIEEPGSFSAQYQHHLRERLLTLDLPSTIVLHDLLPDLQRARQEADSLFFPNEGHLNIKGHEAVANALVNALQR